MGAFKLTVATAVIAIGLGGCQKAGTPAMTNAAGGNTAAAADTGAIEDAIKADVKKWNDEFQAKPWNVDALVAHYAPDAFFVAPGLKHASGIDAIRKAYADFAKDANADVTVESDTVGVAASGDIAYSRGHFSEKYTDPKTQKVTGDSGSYLTVYKKQADGSWKAVEDFAAAEPAS